MDCIEYLDRLIAEKRREQNELRLDVVNRLTMSSEDFQDFKVKFAELSGYIRALEELRMNLIMGGFDNGD